MAIPQESVNVELDQNGKLPDDGLDKIKRDIGALCRSTANGDDLPLTGGTLSGDLVLSNNADLTIENMAGTGERIALAGADGTLTTLANPASAGGYGSAGRTLLVTVDLHGRVTGIADAPIHISESQVIGLTEALAIARGEAQRLNHNRQIYDPALTALSSLNFTAGLLVQTKPKTFTKRTITGTSGQVGVANGDGATANPTISLPATITQATTFQVAAGVTAVAGSTQDGIRIAGLAHGAGSRIVTLTPARLSGSWTQTVPDKSGVQALTSDLPAMQPAPACRCQPLPPSSFGSFPASPLAIPANDHRVNTLAAILGA